METALPKVLIGSPIHQKPAILREFLHSLTELKIIADFYFIDDNADTRSKQLLTLFKDYMENRAEVIVRPSPFIDHYVKDEQTHQWNQHLIWKVAQFKDLMIEYAKQNQYDYLFLIDSDLLLHPQTINKLIDSNKDIISEIFWTKWQPNAIEQPQVWLKDEYTQVIEDDKNTNSYAALMEFYQKLRNPGVYEIGGLGACTLISKKALDAGVKFARIYNLSFWGEDRHFCVRAAALGFQLYVETTYPAYHIYRDSDLAGVEQFKQQSNYSASNPIPVAKGAKLTLSMIVKNEAGKFLEEVLQHAKQYIDNAVIIDDHSTDETKDIVRRVLADIPYVLVENDESKFHNEIELRKQQWEEVIKTNPEWIINLDADEKFEDAFITGVRELINEQHVFLYSFRLYDFWNETEYREDKFWNSHSRYRPFLLKFVDKFMYTWNEQSQHCGRYPNNAFQLPNKISHYRVKHYGWSREDIRKDKYLRYKKLDPNGQFGVLDQYESILDENPNLVVFKE